MPPHLSQIIGPVATGDWVHDARCGPDTADLFFPAKGMSTTEAKAICAGCPVARECLLWALRMRPRHGVYGGQSERERRKLEQMINRPDARRHA